MRLSGPALAPPEAGQARGRPQLPCERILVLRHLERLLKVSLGVSDCRRRATEQEQLALGAEQLGAAPSLFSPLDAREGIVDSRQALGNLPRRAEARRELGKQISVQVENAL